MPVDIPINVEVPEEEYLEDETLDGDLDDDDELISGILTTDGLLPSGGWCSAGCSAQGDSIPGRCSLRSAAASSPCVTWRVRAAASRLAA